MKTLFVICILSLVDLIGFSQTDSLTIYNWSDLNKYNPDTIYALSFEKLKLEEVPKDLAKFKNLKYLDLSKNKLNDLPDFIGDLSSLETIDVSRNKLLNFPVEICRLLQLKKIIANRNLFEIIPECIGYCSELEVLDLWNTPINSFPESISNLKKLKELDLQGIQYGPTFQKNFQSKIPWVKIKFDPPCDCME